MTGHAKLRILICSGLVLAALCTIVALRVIRSTTKPPARAEQITLVAPQLKIAPTSPGNLPPRVRTSPPKDQPVPQPDTGNHNEKETAVRGPVRPELVLNICSTRWRLPSAFHDGWGPDSFYLGERDIERVGSLERALKGIPGVVVR